MDNGIGSWIHARAARRGHDTALVDGSSGTRRSYAELDARVDRLAAALYAAGIRHGDRVGLLSTNSVGFFELVFAVARAGAVLVPINFRLSAREIAFILSDSGLRLMFSAPAFDALVHEAMALQENLCQRVLPTDEAGLEIFTNVDGGRFSGADVALEDLCMIMYTSGTTGHPKGAMLTHGNMLWNAINMCGSPEGLLRTDATLAVAPLFHIGAMGIYSLPLLYLGGKVVTIDQFSADTVLALMARERITVQFMVPTMWSALMQSPALPAFDSQQIRWSMSGGSPCPQRVLEHFGDRGWRLVEGYGLTETAPVCTVADPDRIREKPASVGLPLRHLECRVIGSDDVDLPVGEIGELVVRGPNVFKGYWGLVHESAQALAGGWFHTGDLASRDEDGYFTLVDRKKDMIITGGENVYPAEVERQLLLHPDVAEVAVIGEPDSKWGEAVMAIVVPKPATDPNVEEIINWMRGRLAHFKCPRRIELVTELPRNATGKLLKRTLRERFTGSDRAFTR